MPIHLSNHIRRFALGINAPLILAPSSQVKAQVGFEPTTSQLTADRSTTEVGRA
jgi:hypothetical protein